MCMYSISCIPAATLNSYAGLASFWIGRETDGRKSKKWIARGVECKDAIEKLATSASEWNFQNSEYEYACLFVPVDLLYLDKMQD